jgi:prepilin-type N-terminal cleavage/methylation domain-containing protein
MRRGMTLVELSLALAIAGILATAGVSGARRLLDGMSVRAAAAEAHTLFGAARQFAILRGRMVTLEIDTAGRRLVLRAGADTLRVRELGQVHGVGLAATRLATSYAANGVGYGASNLTLVVMRGRAADTLTVSRLGRVRRQ